MSLTGFKNVKNINSSEKGIVYEDNHADTYIVGDSRVYYMRNSLKDASDFNWLGICGSGYSQLTNEFSYILKGENLKGKTILVESGLNDILFYGGPQSAYSSYYKFYNSLAQKWIKRGATVKMIKILPIRPDGGDNDEKSAIILQYNDILQANLPKNIGVVDINTVPLGFVDDLHFDDATSVKLYDVLKQYK